MGTRSPQGMCRIPQGTCTLHFPVLGNVAVNVSLPFPFLGNDTGCSRCAPAKGGTVPYSFLQNAMAKEHLKSPGTVGCPLTVLGDA